MVWAHVRGEETKTGRYRIHFFGDYSTSEVTKGKIMHLLEGFDKFTTMVKPSILLCKAIEEAKYFIFDKVRSSCPICKMLKSKSNAS